MANFENKENELKEIVSSINESIEDIDFDKFKVIDERFILPQNWKLD